MKAPARISISRRSAEAIASETPHPYLDRAIEELRSALAPREPKPQAQKSRETMKAKKRAVRSAWEAIKLEVRKRSGGTCELCRVRVASDVHHAFGGRNRRSHQSARSCIDVCRQCHDQIGGPDALFWAVEQREHFMRHGFIEEAAEMRKRIDLLRDRAALSAKSEEVGRG